jgi:hypothetical protein
MARLVWQKAKSSRRVNLEHRCPSEFYGSEPGDLAYIHSHCHHYLRNKDPQMFNILQCKERDVPYALRSLQKDCLLENNCGQDVGLWAGKIPCVLLIRLSGSPVIMEIRIVAPQKYRPVVRVHCTFPTCISGDSKSAYRTSSNTSCPLRPYLQ